MLLVTLKVQEIIVKFCSLSHAHNQTHQCNVHTYTYVYIYTSIYHYMHVWCIYVIGSTISELSAQKVRLGYNFIRFFLYLYSPCFIFCWIFLRRWQRAPTIYTHTSQPEYVCVSALLYTHTYVQTVLGNIAEPESETETPLAKKAAQMMTALTKCPACIHTHISV